MHLYSRSILRITLNHLAHQKVAAIRADDCRVLLTRWDIKSVTFFKGYFFITKLKRESAAKYVHADFVLVDMRRVLRSCVIMPFIHVRESFVSQFVLQYLFIHN